jgi:hypothetical protein
MRNRNWSDIPRVDVFRRIKANIGQQLVALVSTQAVQPSQQPDSRITVAEYFAEIVQGQGADGPISH